PVLRFGAQSEARMEAIQKDVEGLLARRSADLGRRHRQRAGARPGTFPYRGGAADRRRAATGGLVNRPNVLLIVSDDHGYADRGDRAHDQRVRTPNLDRLAAGGVDCSDGYVTAPICSPSRAGLISGHYQQRWGARWFDDSRFPDHLPSLAERFAGLGYRTGYFGKVHYGPEDVGDR